MTAATYMHRGLLPLFVLALSLGSNFTVQGDEGVPPNTENSLVIEAENFASQHLDSKRRWIVFSKESQPHHYPDADQPHYHNASAGKYIELLPDTRTNHHELLEQGENFSQQPGKLAILSYPTYFASPGKYYVWARAYSTGSEDNGVHIGLNGQWPASGQRLQLCQGKHQWTWSSAQRSKENHCGVANTISLDIPSAGVHTIQVSMREDGFELDQLLLTMNKDVQPQGIVPGKPKVSSAPLEKKVMLHQIDNYQRILAAPTDFAYPTSNNHDVEQIPFYHHKKEHALAINAVQQTFRNQFAYAEYQVQAKEAGQYTLTLVTLSEIDGESKYQVMINDKIVGQFQNPETAIDYQEAYFHIDKVTLLKDDIIKVAAMAVTNGKIPENGGTAFARGRWRALVLSRPES
ncbi:hypothetical protein [Thalassotalea litorea]|uniref:hypothetical protein n=1 Tax=Thalassotalea litorea TaxID=2020715 RepID=UPI001FE434A4|nr:hypothetical protein [Thalassotalea litorea]